MSVVFLATPAVLIGIVAVVTVTEVSLRTQPGIDVRRDEAAPPVAAVGPSATPVVLPAGGAVPDAARGEGRAVTHGRRCPRPGR